MSNVIRYTIDQRVGKFTVQAFADGMLSMLGHSPTFAARDYEGVIECDPETGEGASFALKVNAASLELVDDLSSSDRRRIKETMHDEVLESENFPEIVYDCPADDMTVKRTGDGQFDVSLNGNLTLHGVTNRHPITGKVIANPAMLRAFGEFQIGQTNFNIKLVSVAGGILRVKDELKCAFDIVARRLPASF
jgi:polyisoprenoid-binding protein YceI